MFQVDGALADTVVTQLNRPGVVFVESGREDGLSQFRAVSLSLLDELGDGQHQMSSSGVDIRDRVTDDVLCDVAGDDRIDRARGCTRRTRGFRGPPQYRARRHEAAARPRRVHGA